jgi:hypothetical protein
MTALPTRQVPHHITPSGEMIVGGGSRTVTDFMSTQEARWREGERDGDDNGESMQGEWPPSFLVAFSQYEQVPDDCSQPSWRPAAIGLRQRL